MTGRIALRFVALGYLAALLVVPVGMVFYRAFEKGIGPAWDAVTTPPAQHAFWLTLTVVGIAVPLNAVFGVLTAWLMARRQFPGKRILDALIDLPFGLPTAVAGISLTSLYATTGWIGAPFAGIDVRIAFTQAGILVALVFVGLPFVVRTVEPVLRDLEREHEEAAALLGARRGQILARVVFPPLLPALLTGFTLAFARAIGEYGSVIFIAGNVPRISEILPLLIIIKLEQFDYAGALAIATMMLAASFVLLLAINLLQAWTRRRHGG